MSRDGAWSKNGKTTAVSQDADGSFSMMVQNSGLRKNDQWSL